MGQRILSGLTSLMGVEDGDINITVDSKGQKSGLETISTWIAQLSEALSQIPNIDLSFSSDVSCTPLQRCLAREISRGKQILSSVLDDISLVKYVTIFPPSLTSPSRSFYSGEIKSTNAIREFISCFLKGTVPLQWQAHFVATSRTTVGGWVSNLSARCSFLQRYSATVVKAEEGMGAVSPQYWLGGFFSPEAFITATRQTTAQVRYLDPHIRLLTLLLLSFSSPIAGASKSLSCISKSEKVEPMATATSSRD